MSIISVSNLSKRYIIGHDRKAGGAFRYKSLRDSLTHLGRSAYQRILHPLSPNRENTDLEEFWALKDVSFEINQGDRVGIIGRNGAGKSTLLKILSRITEPTTGKIQIKGRVASLLEVGTGFHPELSGRENIYLNGAVLGMTRAEIKRKFDEIVAFAEVEKFLDTPVKHYSSGMYVRLAFAVAAHLEPEILIIDEVLAVGDAQFQKKCLGKMEDVSKKEGRTVLFVSHNMSAVTSLCERCLLLDSGTLATDGRTSDVILKYYSNKTSNFASVDFSNNQIPIGDEYATLISAAIKNSEGGVVSEVDINESVTVNMCFRILKSSNIKYLPNFHFTTPDGTHAFAAHYQDAETLNPGDYVAECFIPANFFNDMTYFVGVALTSFGADIKLCYYQQGILSFNVKDPIEGTPCRATGYAGPMPGVIRPQFKWKIKSAETTFYKIIKQEKD